MALIHNVLHRDGTDKIYQSDAISGQYLYVTGSGDDIVNNKVGEGEKLIITNESGSTTILKEVQFLEDIQLKTAYFFWENAKWGDSLNGEIILPANTPYIKSDNKGNAALVDGVITHITSSQTPDNTWNGTHILFPIDVPLVRFVNKCPLSGTNNTGFKTDPSGVALVSKDLKLRLTFTTDSNSPNTVIKLSAVIEMFRIRTL